MQSCFYVRDCRYSAAKMSSKFLMVLNQDFTQFLKILFHRGWDEEMKRKMYEDFYEHQYPEYLKQMYVQNVDHILLHFSHFFNEFQTGIFLTCVP